MKTNSVSNYLNPTVIIFIAFSQGLLSLTDLATFYLLKDDLGFSPSKVSFFSSIVMIPWMIKPLWGFISDSYPILNKRRSPYLFIFGLSQCLFWITLSNISYTTFKVFLIILFNNISTCFCNVIGEALVVEESQKFNHDQTKAANYVTLFFGARAVGILLTSYTSGYLLEIVSKQTIFFIAAFFPILIITSAFILQEELVQTEIKVKEQVGLISKFFLKKEIFVPVLFIFLFAAVPGCGDAMYFFYTNKLGFEPEFMGRLKFIYGIGTIIGMVLYNFWLKDFSFKKLLIYSTIVCMVINLAQVLLVCRVNRAIGIPDEAFAIACSFIVQITAELNIMPLLVLCCKVCPKNIEGSLYALLMSTWNFGLMASGQLGGLMLMILGITDKNFENLWILVVVTSGLMVLPLPILYWVKEDESIDNKYEKV
jgi:folate/biopterin transporter